MLWERKQKNKWIIIEDGNEFKFDIWESQSASNVWVEMVNPGPSDAGRYRCRGVNQFGEDSKTVDVECNISFSNTFDIDFLSIFYYLRKKK